MTTTQTPRERPRERPRFRVVAARAATAPLNLGVGAAAATLAIGLSSLPIAALGALAYGALVAFDTFNPAFWKKVYALPAAQQRALPAADTVDDPQTRAAVEQFAEARAQIARTAAGASPQVTAQLAHVLASLGDLEDRAARLVERAEALAKYLGTTSAARVRAQIAELHGRVATTRDAGARKNFDDALAARNDELRTLGELAAAKDRIDASLAHMVAVLGGVPAKLVHVQALDQQAADQLSGDVTAELDAVSAELRTSEEVMKSLGELR